MNQAFHSPTTMLTETTYVELELLQQRGFTPEECRSLLNLREWYQDGGSDRASVVRHLEFLKLLVWTGKIDL